jgi:MFS family permease
VSRFGDLMADTFSPLRVRNFRLYLSGQAISLLGTWMQVAAQGWVVWELTKSPAALGTVAMLGSLPLLVLGPFAGAWSDRLDRRRVLIWTQVMAMVLAITLAILVQTELIQIWHVYLLALSLGAITALDFPTQQAFIGDIAGVGEIRKIVVVNAMINQMTRMVGPTLAGWVMGALGVAPAFWLNGISFLAVIATLVAIRSNQVQRASVDTRPLSQFVDGLKFIRSQPRIQDLMIVTAFATFFGIATMLIMPAFAAQVLHGDAKTYGAIMGANGAGALFSTILLVPMLQRVRRTGLMISTVLLWVGACIGLLSYTSWTPVALLCMFGIGLGIPVVMTTANGLLQTLAPVTMRGRLISVWFMVGFGLQPISSIFVGHVAEWFTTSVAIRTNAVLMVGGTLFVLLLRPGFRAWEANMHAKESKQSAVEPVTA